MNLIKKKYILEKQYGVWSELSETPIKPKKINLRSPKVGNIFFRLK